MNSTRRSLIRRGAALAATGALAASGVFAPSLVQAQGGAGLPMPNVKALVFDTFGTVVDWRNGVARETERILKPMGYDLDWLAFAEAWRKEYGPSMEEIRSGRRPFVKLDILHRENLDRLRPRFKLEKLDESTLAELNLAWHKLDAWPDVGPGFARLHKRFLMAPCSNGNIALMADVARRNNLPWDAILGSEIAQGYKPQPKVYLATCEAFNLKPAQVMMCAAHSGDLAAARALGLRTGPYRSPPERAVRAPAKPNRRARSTWSARTSTTLRTNSGSEEAAPTTLRHVGGIAELRPSASSGVAHSNPYSFAFNCDYGRTTW
jgi:2-haloacid dehalogenase